MASKKLGEMLVMARSRISRVLKKGKDIDVATIYEQWEESQEKDDGMVVFRPLVQEQVPTPKWWWSITYPETATSTSDLPHLPAKTDLKHYLDSYRSLLRKRQVKITKDLMYIGIYSNESAWSALTGTLDKMEISETNLATAILKSSTGISSVVPDSTSCVVIEHGCIYASEAAGGTKVIFADESESTSELMLDNNAHTQILQVSRVVRYPFLEPDIPNQQELSEAPALPKRNKHIINSRDKYLIFGSRVFWEHISDHEAASLVRSNIVTGIAEKLIERALREVARRRNETRNALRHKKIDITVAVVALPPIS